MSYLSPLRYVFQAIANSPLQTPEQVKAKKRAKKEKKAARAAAKAEAAATGVKPSKAKKSAAAAVGGAGAAPAPPAPVQEAPQPTGSETPAAQSGTVTQRRQATVEEAEEE
jgi:translocation protein SEC62